MRQNQKMSYFLEVAKLTAKLSTCRSMSVGAVIVQDGHIVATGYNGVPSGMTHCNEQDVEDHHAFANEYEIHAEMNALFDALDRGQIVRGATLYCTHSPCANCYKHIVRAGIKEVIYDEVYHRSSKAEITDRVLKFANGKSIPDFVTCDQFVNDEKNI